MTTHGIIKDELEDYRRFTGAYVEDIILRLKEKMAEREGVEPSVQQGNVLLINKFSVVIYRPLTLY